MSIIRAFVAIQLPPNVLNSLAQINKELAVQIPQNSVRWVKPHLIHLTLRFLGDTAESTLPSLFNALDETVAQHNAFSLNLDQLGCFPNCKRPRVIWVGLQGQLDALNTLKREIDEALQRLGWDQEDKAFRPHLTLGRVKDSGNLQDSNWEAQIDQQQMLVSAVYLIESKLTSNGPIYTTRHTTHLHHPS